MKMVWNSSPFALTEYLLENCTHFVIIHFALAAKICPLTDFKLSFSQNNYTFIDLTKFAVLFATSLADCTKCFLATAFEVFEEAIRQTLQSADVCFATMVAADKTCSKASGWGRSWKTRKFSATAAKPTAEVSKIDYN